ncbi:hypothetical protein MHTCC0001_29900 [Flavobacteriaceae bacterium MHTCC 0001]
MKNLKTFLFLFIIGNLALAQKEVDTSWKDYINPIFQGLNKSNIPHAILLDYAMEFIDVPSYNGTLTSNNYIDTKSFSNIYKTLYMGKVTSSTTYFPTMHTVAYNWATARMNNNASQKNTLVIMGLLYNYSIIDPNALSQNKITVSNNKYYDKYTWNVWQNPYLSKRAIAFSLPLTTYNKRNINVIIPSNLMLSNMASQIQKIEFNANDGQGYRVINYNQSIAVNYTSNGTYTWVFKVTLNNNQILYSHTKLNINQEFTSTSWANRYGN